MGISNDAEGGKASFSSIDLLDPAYCFGWHAVLKNIRAPLGLPPF